MFKPLPDYLYIVHIEARKTDGVIGRINLGAAETFEIAQDRVRNRDDVRAFCIQRAEVIDDDGHRDNYVSIAWSRNWFQEPGELIAPAF